mmetsp:Transcript_31190/g.89103  ORF Transcript_31190/g.89103 Transcript_31190/m.89103 type:complete len:202 (-) Transcript_31190:7-612(-)
MVAVRDSGRVAAGCARHCGGLHMYAAGEPGIVPAGVGHETQARDNRRRVDQRLEPKLALGPGMLGGPALAPQRLAGAWAHREIVEPHRPSGIAHPHVPSLGARRRRHADEPCGRAGSARCAVVPRRGRGVCAVAHRPEAVGGRGRGRRREAGDREVSPHRAGATRGLPGAQRCRRRVMRGKRRRRSCASQEQQRTSAHMPP